MATAVATPADLSHSNSNSNPNNGEYLINGGGSNASSQKKKSRESERRRRRRKQKKNKNSSANATGDDEDSDALMADDDSSKENNYPNNHKVLFQFLRYFSNLGFVPVWFIFNLLQVDFSVEVEYVPEKAEVDASFLEDFKSVFEKFSFKETDPISEEDAKKEEASDAAKNKDDSDSDEEEQEGQQKKDGAVSNKKRKVRKQFSLFFLFKFSFGLLRDFLLISKFSYFLQLQRRMKIAELKQICSKPDVVEVLYFDT